MYARKTPPRDTGMVDIKGRPIMEFNVLQLTGELRGIVKTVPGKGAFACYYLNDEGEDTGDFDYMYQFDPEDMAVIGGAETGGSNED